MVKFIFSSIISIGFLAGCTGFKMTDTSLKNSDTGTVELPTAPIKPGPIDTPVDEPNDSVPASSTTTSTTSTTTTSTTTTLPNTEKPTPAPTEPVVTQPTQPPEKPADPEMEDLVAGGTVVPTIYYTPRIHEFPNCVADAPVTGSAIKTTLRNKKSEPIVSVCKKGFDSCLMQGACDVVKNDGSHLLINVADSDKFMFAIVPSSSLCQYGYGVSGACLDSFYTVAADLHVYKAGDVIYIPEIAKAKIKLGENHFHNGYFIVRDTGGAFKKMGPNRFDFFTGRLDYRDKKNPFSAIGLSDKNTKKFKFYKVVGKRKDKVRQSRCYPALPNPDRTCPK